VLAAMSEPQRVGQLFMVHAAATGPSEATYSAITEHDVGAVILMGGAQASVAQTASVSASVQRQAAGPARLLIATDQEGGDVQALAGPGFAAIPSALAQGAIPPAQLRAHARSWGQQLAAAGVNVDLAPVLDTVTSPAFAAQNPIGADDRAYGFDPATVSSHGNAFAAGLADAGVLATAKHFPGLGRVSANTDTSAQVTDGTTTSQDAYLRPFADAIRAGIPIVMVSTAYYSRIDPTQPAVFSPVVINTLLRGRLGFRGLVISDDVGAAAQVASVPIADRALRIIAAGADIALTVDETQIPEMTAAVLHRVTQDAGFRAAVDRAARRVLAAKQAAGLLREP
jgi:beta-N-acetylhexosaminidase